MLVLRRFFNLYVLLLHIFLNGSHLGDYVLCKWVGDVCLLAGIVLLFNIVVEAVWVLSKYSSPKSRPSSNGLLRVESPLKLVHLENILNLFMKLRQT